MPLPVTKRHIRIITVSAGVLMLAGILYALTSAYARRWLCEQGVALLAEKLGTSLHVGNVDVSLMRREVTLYGIELEDKRQERMLSIDTLGAKIELLPLFDSKLEIRNLRCFGLTANLYKEHKDSAANYQFIIDALRSKKPSDDNQAADKKQTLSDLDIRSAVFNRVKLRWDVYSEPIKGGDTLDGNHIRIEGLRFQIAGITRKDNSLTATLAGLEGRETKSKTTLAVGNACYTARQDSNVTVNVGQLRCSFGDKRVTCSTLSATQRRKQFSPDHPMTLRVDSMIFFRNNGKPHKRTGKPHRGWFDPGHLDVLFNVNADVQYITRDSIKAKVTRMSAHDRASGLYIKNLTTLLSRRNDTITLDDINLSMRQTAIKIPRMETRLLRNSEGKATDLMTKPFTLRANIDLRDLSKPFAPVLSDFTTPLRLSVVTSGTLAHLTLSDIRVQTHDRRLRLTASGDLHDVTKKRELRLNFTNINLDARKEIKEVIIHHFSKKIRMKMIRQIRKIGDIRYRGSMGVYYKREDFSGTLFTKYGDADFAFVINNKTKYMTGSISSEAFDLGSVMNVKKLGSIKANATYSFNVASKAKRPIKNNGRLPIGWVKAHVDSAKYKGVNISKVSAMVTSDGATAMGEVFLPKKLFDISLLFWYTQTDSVQEMKLKPRLLKHQKSPDMLTDKKKWKDYMKEARQRAKARKRKGDKTKET